MGALDLRWHSAVARRHRVSRSTSVIQHNLLPVLRKVTAKTADANHLNLGTPLSQARPTAERSSHRTAHPAFGIDRIRGWAGKTLICLSDAAEKVNTRSHDQLGQLAGCNDCEDHSPEKILQMSAACSNNTALTMSLTFHNSCEHISSRPSTHVVVVLQNPRSHGCGNVFLVVRMSSHAAPTCVPVSRSLIMVQP